jgi:signal transduction histidine kinase
MAVVMGLVFGGLRVAAAANTATGFARTNQLALLGQQVTALAQALENERDKTAGYDAAAGLDLGTAPLGSTPVAYTKAQVGAYQTEMNDAQNTTKAVAVGVKRLAGQIDGAFPAVVQSKAQDVLNVIADLDGTRSAALAQSSEAAIESYSEAIAFLFALNDEITSGSGDPVLADEVRTLDSISRAKDQASQQRAILYAALIDSYFASGAQLSLTTSGELENADLISFESSATSAEVSQYLVTVSGLPVNASQLLNNYMQMAGSSTSGTTTPATTGSGTGTGTGTGTGKTGSGKGKPAPPPATAPMTLIKYACDLSPTSETGNGVYCKGAASIWYGDMTGTIGRIGSVEQQLASQIVTRSQALEHGARQSAEFTAAITGAVLLLVLIATIIVARSLVEPLRRLQADALEVATVRLPERVAELSETTDPQAALQIEPISVNSTDEIGKVARAFDQVHREAVRLAGNEALLRGNLNAMFISLSRRSVPLIERLARMIDSLEQNEDDPDRLSNLFSMDHLVTRMRRNSENLLVLAGEEPVRKWSEPVPLADVARAATSEIEQYSRVVLNIQPGIAVSGQAAADVVHLLAEIIENATMFSPRDTPVHVSGQEVSSGGVLIEVRDSGVGVSPPRLSEMNWRLDNPPLIDVSVSRHMGLFAVSRLAARHGVRVRLRPVSPQGLSALVWLPGNLVGREAIKYADRVQFAAQAPAPQLRMGGRRITGRHRHGLRSGEELPGIAAPMPTGAGVQSNWFRPKRPSNGAASPGTGPIPQQAVTGTLAQEALGRAAGGEGWSNGGRGASADTWSDGVRASGAESWSDGQGNGSWSDGQGNGNWSDSQGNGSWSDGQGNGNWSDSQGSGSWSSGQGSGGWSDGGWRPGEVSSPVQGDRTSAGLPTRIPKANLFPGSMGGGRGNGPSTGDMPAYGQPTGGYETAPPTASYETETPTYPQSAPPRRSAEMARSRLSGFQLGSRDAQGRRPHDGEEG